MLVVVTSSAEKDIVVVRLHVNDPGIYYVYMYYMRTLKMKAAIMFEEVSGPVSRSCPDLTGQYQTL
jgi:precorrin-4 methylase